MKPQRNSITQIRNFKGAQPIVCLTAYTAPMAKLLDPHVDLLLVGDSLGMVLYGMDSTLPVTPEMMIAHGQAVMRGSEKALVAVDLPFASYQASPEQAFATASSIMQQVGCAAVKLEGGVEMAETIRFLTERGIPVMAHIGLMPQHVNQLGGYKVQGKSKESQKHLLKTAEALQEAGAFAIVLEGTQTDSAARITKQLSIPTIGIGAGKDCDGQVLVTEDMLGMFTDFTPKFVRKYATLADDVEEAVKRFSADIRGRTFPGDNESFS